MTTNDIVQEPEVMDNMLRRATRNHLLLEVVAAFDLYRNAGDDIPEAARCALYDWDC